MKKNFVASVLMVLLLGNTNVVSQTNPVLPTDFSSQAALNPDVNFIQPAGLTFNNDGSKMFVWEKQGKVFVCNWNGSTYVRQNTPVLDITSEVGDWGDMGLLGFALDPNFNTNKMIYLLYVVDQGFLLNGVPDETRNYRATIGRITKYATTTNGSGEIVVVPSSRVIILGNQKNNGIPILHDSHGVGSLNFGSDGTLLVSNGDGASYLGNDPGGTGCVGCGSYAPEGLSLGIIRPNEDVGAYRAQMLNSFSGKILRMDTDGNGIPSNPFFDPANPRSPKSLTFALGLRNPFRFSIKPNTGAILPTAGEPGTLYIGDVGWEAREELNICDKAGQNFGWPLFQGMGRLFNYWPFNGHAKENKDEPNPLFGVNGCTVQYFRFSDLMRDEHPNGDAAVFNPCNSTVQINPGGPAIRFVHRRPKLDWFHTDRLSDPNYPAKGARVPTFNGNFVTEKLLGEAGCPVAGPSFTGRASIGNSFYTGNKYPPEYTNSLFFSDYGNWIKNITFVSDNTLGEVKGFATINVTTSDPATRNLQAVAMKQSPMDGLMYYVNYIYPAGQSITGIVRKLAYGGISNNLPPTANITITNNSGKNYGPSPLAISFGSAGSSDPDGAIQSYQWDFGDGTTGTGATISHTFSASGPQNFTVKLTVTDNANATGTSTIFISANNSPPIVTITNPPNNSLYPTGQVSSYNLTASVADAEHPGSQLSYSWQTILRHNTHEHAGPIMTDVSPTTSIGGEGCDGETYYYLIRLTVADPLGLSTTAESSIFPDCAPTSVTIVSFTASKKGRGVNVAWRAMNQSFLEKYVVERSADGSNFISIGEVGPIPPASGLSHTDYLFFDNKPLPGKSYYRLRMQYVDGRVEYSLIISITLKGGSTLTQITNVYPTPFTTDLTVETYFYKPEEVTIQLVDVQGRVLISRKQTVGPETTVLTVGGLQNILPGTYYLNIIASDGEVRKAKVIKM